jgi:hypothetical protein
MSDSATPKLLPLIRKVREERLSKDLTRLTDAELLAKLVRGLGNDTGDERPIACAMAVHWKARHGRRDQRESDLREALALLEQAGYSGFSLEQLAAVPQSAAFRELRDFYVVWRKPSTNLAHSECAEFYERFRDKSLAAGAAAAG